MKQRVVIYWTKMCLKEHILFSLVYGSENETKLRYIPPILTWMFNARTIFYIRLIIDSDLSYKQ